MRRVVVFGGTGFLGRVLSARLLDAGFGVRVVARRLPSPGDALATEIETVTADIRNPQQVTDAVEGAWAVVNSVALYHERRADRFADVHEDGAFRLAAAAAETGAERFILISGLGVDAASPSSYVRARAHGETRTRTGFPDATILRPSALFGPGAGLLGSLEDLTRVLPLFPLFGAGEVLMQPVHVEDVAEAAVRCLGDPATAGQVYELGGPDRASYRALVKQILQAYDRRRLLLPVPFAVWGLVARLMSPLPSPPVTVHQLALLANDNVVAPGALGLADLGIAAQPIADALPGGRQGAADR